MDSKYFDHTILKADATKEDILRICSEAKKYDFASVCVNSYWTGLAADELKESNVKVCTVVGFPLGAMSVNAKAYETKDAVNAGADEIDQRHRGGEKGGMEIADMDNIVCKEEHRKIVSAPLCR